MMNDQWRKGISVVVIIGIAIAISIVWWRAWMYHSFPGPIPVLHWLMSGDGEGSYGMTMIEMFLHVFLPGVFVIALFFRSPEARALNGLNTGT